MKALALAALLALSTNAVAQDEIDTGNGLLRACTSQDVRIWAVCFGFINGVEQGYEMGMIFAGLSVGPVPRAFRFCFPEEVTRQQTMDVVVTYLKAHPADRHKRAAILVGVALKEAWPCPE